MTPIHRHPDRGRKRPSGGIYSARFCRPRRYLSEGLSEPRRWRPTPCTRRPLSVSDRGGQERLAAGWLAEAEDTCVIRSNASAMRDEKGPARSRIPISEEFIGSGGRGFPLRNACEACSRGGPDWDRYRYRYRYRYRTNPDGLPSHVSIPIAIAIAIATRGTCSMIEAPFRLCDTAHPLMARQNAPNTNIYPAKGA
jgi:hypothetical protein